MGWAWALFLCQSALSRGMREAAAEVGGTTAVDSSSIPYVRNFGVMKSKLSEKLIQFRVKPYKLLKITGFTQQISM